MSNYDAILIAYDVNKNGLSKLKILEGFITRNDITIALQKNSPFTFEFETCFMKFAENGLISKRNNDIYDQIPKRASDEDV